MPFNGSGTFSLTYNWVTEQASSPIEISKLDGQESDIAAGLSNCILRDGTGVPTSATPWNSQNLTGVGSLTAVSGTFSSSVTATALIPSSSTVPANGVYLPAANTVGFATNSTRRWSIDSTGQLTNVGSALDEVIAVNGTGSPYISLYKSGTLTGYLSVDGSNFNVVANTGKGMNFSVGGATRGSISSTGNWSINAPSSGTALTVTGVAGATSAVTINHDATAAGLTLSNGSGSLTLAGQGGSAFINTPGAWGMLLQTNSTTRLNIGSSGNVTINAPSSGAALQVAGLGSSATTQAWTGGSTVALSQGTVAGDTGIGTSSSHAFNIFSAGANRMQFGTAGNVTINAASSGTELTVTGEVVATSFAGDGSGLTSLSATQLTSGTVPDARFPATLPAASGVNLTALNASNLGSGTVPAARIGSSTDYAIGDGSTVNSIQIGFRGIPQNAQTGNYTCVLADAGKHIYHAAGAGSGDTYTIPANGSVAYAIGTAITFINRDTTNSVSIAITTDTLTMAVTGSTGTRTLAPYGTATAIKITSTEWLISGSGLT